ncbi:substrate-binding periplasmic protein [Zavarzinia sp. CC-PAN008]|uniref:substrate-binding periplasmic protein n=1 Tax=Zavarzinia sp. CC-PAN008 TaxID=3243332 RepID=UPI003F7495FA
MPRGPSRRGLVLLGLAALAAWASPRAGASAQEPVKLVVGVENQDYMPVYGVADGQYVGFARELLDAFAQDRGYVFEYRPLPVPRLYASLFAGQVDFKFPDDPSWRAEERAGKALVYSGGMARYIDGTMVTQAKVGSAPEAIGKLGTITGFAPYVWLDRIAQGKPVLVENGDMRALVAQVTTGRIDGAYVNVAVATREAREAGLPAEALVFDPGLPYSAAVYRISTLTKGEVIRQLDEWIMANGTRVEAMRQRHGVEAGLDRR